MANAAYWFRHDTNAKDDHKIMLLMDQLGLEGYGIYWILIEVLREQEGYIYPLSMLPILAKRYYSSAEKFKAVTLNYGLFEVIEGDNFSSLSLLRRMGEYDKYCEQRRLAGKKGGLEKVARAKHTLSIPVACAKHKSSTRLPSGEERSGEDGIREDRKGLESSENICRSFDHLSITQTNFDKLIKVYGVDKVNDILDRIENHAGNKKYKSLYLTASNWLKSEKSNKPNQPQGDWDLTGLVSVEEVLRERR